MIKNNLRIISKPHACLQTMFKAPVKFQKKRYKIVGGDAHTRYPLSIHFESKNARKMAIKVQLAEKVIKLRLYPNHMHIYLQSSDYVQITCEVSKESA